MTTRKAPPAAESTKRARADAAPEEPSKRARVDAALRSQLEEHRCPITLELMVDPVVAPDGRLYEREAITRWLDTTNRVVVGRSPATNEMMVGELIPIHPVRNAIEALVKGGCVEPEDEAPWQMRRGRMLEARGDRAGAAKCFERARALGYEDDALLLLRRRPRRVLTPNGPWRRRARCGARPAAACRGGPNRANTTRGSWTSS